MSQSVQREIQDWDAYCVTCDQGMMEWDWAVDASPDGTEDIRFCPLCGEQALRFSGPKQIPHAA